ncbi:unnamed protein product, partial [Sphagnum balticum]
PSCCSLLYHNSHEYTSITDHIAISHGQSIFDVTAPPSPTSAVVNNAQQLGVGINAAEVEALKKTFAKFDSDGDGKISLDELTVALNASGKKTSKMEAKMLMNQVDKSRKGYIVFEEFASYMTTPTTTVRDVVKERFAVFDKDGDGFITRDEMNSIVKELDLGSEWTPAVINKLFTDADSNGDGMIDFEEFREAFAKS